MGSLAAGALDGVHNFGDPHSLGRICGFGSEGVRISEVVVVVVVVRMGAVLKGGLAVRKGGCRCTGVDALPKAPHPPVPLAI